MSQPTPFGFVKTRTWAAAGVLAGMVLLSVLIVWQLSDDARREIDALATASTDSAQWALAQTEVELLALETAVLAARAGAGSLDDVRRRFDVFYARIDTVQTSSHFMEVLDLARAHGAMDLAEDFLDTYVPAIDGPDADLEAALPAMTDALATLRGATREFSLAGVRVMAERTETRRGNVSKALTDLGLISAFLLAILLALLAVLLWMMRASRRQAEQLALTHSRMEAMVSTSLDAIIVVGRDGRVIDFNGAAERIFGYSREEALGAEMSALILPTHLRARHDAGMRQYFATGDRKIVGQGLQQLEAMRKDGSTFPVEFSTNATRSDDGEIFVSYLRDISGRLAAQEELVAARDSAVAGEKAKATLLAVMSHEMRTPLNGVLGTLQLLAGTELDARQRGYVEMMDTSGQLLLEHVNNVLDISRIDAGKAEVTTQAFDLPALARDVAASLETQAAERGNALRVEILGPDPGIVEGDPARLKQVLFNLIGNAIKFTENGRVTVELEREPASGAVEFRVTDTGIGIGEDDLERVFDDFVTLDTSFQREVEGTGLGLGIVRRLVDLLGGEIGVESIPGDGSIFWFRLPLPPAAVAETAPDRLAAPETGGLAAPARVLLVEDNGINRLVAREMLEQYGCTVEEAHDGLQGVETAAARAFDLILMDISMPRLDGIEASRRIRAGTGPNTETPIVALTAHALQADIDRFRAAGMADVLTKPLSFGTMKKVISSFVRPGVARVQPTAAPGHPDELALLASLDPDRAREIRARVDGELRAGFDRLRALTAGAAADRLDREAVAALAHKLIGTAAIGGLDEICDGLRNIETAAPAARPWDLLDMIDTTEAAYRAERATG